jgi:hypothetical protein
MPDESTYGFNRYDADWLVQAIGSRESEILENQPSGGKATIKHAYPPSGGIPAATWESTSETMTPGVASCRLAIRVGGAYEPATTTIMVENPVGAIVGISGKPITIGRNTSGAWTVLVEDCTGTTTTVENVPSGDAVNSGTSGSFDMGYTMGV